MHHSLPRGQSGWRLGCKLENPSATVLGLDCCIGKIKNSSATVLGLDCWIGNCSAGMHSAAIGILD